MLGFPRICRFELYDVLKIIFTEIQSNISIETYSISSLVHTLARESEKGTPIPLYRADLPEHAQ